MQLNSREKERKEERGWEFWVESTGAAVRDPWPQSQPVLLSVLDTPDGLDLRGLTVGSPAPPVLVVSTVSLTLHDVLLAPVARILVAHEAVGGKDKAIKVSRLF